MLKERVVPKSSVTQAFVDSTAIVAQSVHGKSLMYPSTIFAVCELPDEAVTVAPLQRFEKFVVATDQTCEARENMQISLRTAAPF